MFVADVTLSARSVFGGAIRIVLRFSAVQVEVWPSRAAGAVQRELVRWDVGAVRYAGEVGRKP